MKKLVSMLLVICCVFGFCANITTAEAAEYSVPRTYVSLWVNGKYVDVVAWYEEDGSYYLANYTDLNIVFPAETANTTFVPREKAELGPYAKKYGYTMTLEGVNKLVLTKDSGGGEVTIPRTYLEVYRDGKAISGITCWKEEDGKIFVSSYANLRTIFPDETSGISFPTVEGKVELSGYAAQFGYTMKQTGKRLDLTKDSGGGEVTIPRTYLEVYRDGKAISGITCWKEEDGKIFVSSYANLRTLFPDETVEISFPAVEGKVELSGYAAQFGYTMKQTGKRLDLTKDSGGEVTIPRTFLNCFKNDKAISGITCWMEEDGQVFLSSYADLRTLFPDETVGISFPAVEGKVKLSGYATQFGYTLKVTGKRLDVNKTGVDPNAKIELTTYRDGKAISITAWQKDGVVYVGSFTELFKLFEAETKLLKVPNKKGEVALSGYAEMFGFDVKVTGTRLDVTTANVSTDTVEIWINGGKLAIPENIPAPYVTNGTTLVPVRLVTEALGAEVLWFQMKPNDLVTVARGTTTLMIFVGTKDYICNGKHGTAGTEAVYKTVNGNTSTMLPLRVISESLGASITWDQRTHRVIIIDEVMMNK